jgi:arylsulfatase A-like enzyme
MTRSLAIPLRLAVLAAAILLLMACDLARTRPAGILLITLDTTRADHLGCYGDASALTPALDAFAQESVRFDQAMAAVPVTLPSHSTMFTGVYPPTHGVRYNGMFRLGASSVTIAERLRAAGFATAAVPAAFAVSRKSGLDQGFDVYRDLYAEPGAPKLSVDAQRSAADVVKIGLETIRAARQKPFFVWLHFYDAHYPYVPPFPYSARFRDHPYDGEIAYVDAQIAELFAALKKDGLWDRIAVVIAGDHGEGLYQHGERLHSELVYESTLRVPLMIKGPGGSAGTVVHEPVSLADVAPTILDLARLDVPAGLDGISLRGALRSGRAPVRPIYFESLAGSLAFGWSPIEGVRRGKWKLIRGKTAELYDLETDPKELNDLGTVDAATAADLAAHLDADLARWKASASPATEAEAPVDAEALARLASLGYVGGSVTEASQGGPDPKELVHLESELLLLQDLMLSRQYSEALQAIPEILKEDPGNRLALHDAAEASLGVGDPESAEKYAREVIKRYPEFFPAIVTLGRVQVAKKNYREAEELFRDGLRKFPDEPILVYSVALSLIAQGKAKDAEPLAVKALSEKNPDPAFRIVQAVCRAAAADYPGAKKALEEAIAAGYPNTAELRREPLFAPLKQIPDFEAILATKKGA